MSDKVTAAKIELEALVDERKKLRERIAAAEAQLKEDRKRLHEIQGVWSDQGELKTAQLKWHLARLEESDKTRRKVKWVYDPLNAGRNNNTHVVDKVTPKRIYVRWIGSETVQFYPRDDKRIDIEATFPEGIDNYKGGP